VDRGFFVKDSLFSWCFVTKKDPTLHRLSFFYPPLQKTTGLPWMNEQTVVMLWRDVSPKAEVDNCDIAEGEGGYFWGSTGLPVGSIEF
jgi:hypothetical protein